MRVRPVLASQSANPFMTRMQVEFIADKFGPPSHFIYGIAGAPYLGPDGKFNQRDDITLDDLFQKGFPDGFVWVKSCIRQYGVLARYYHLRSMCYEAATALEGDHSLAVKVRANRDPHRKGNHGVPRFLVREWRRSVYVLRVGGDVQQVWMLGVDGRYSEEHAEDEGGGGVRSRADAAVDGRGGGSGEGNGVGI